MTDIFLHRERNYKRAKIVKERNLPTGNLNAYVSRAVYDEFEALAKTRNTTKGALMRSLVIKYILESRDS